MTDTIQFTCPHCSQTMQFPAAVEGKQGKCPSCKVVVTVANNTMVDLASLQQDATPQQVDPSPARPADQQSTVQQPPAAEEVPLEMGNIAFAKENLTEGERILHAGRFHLLRVKVARAIFLLSVPICATFAFFTFGGFMPRLSLPALGLILIAWLEYRVHYHIAYKTEFVLTNKRIITKWGFLRTVTREIQLEKIESVNYGQTLLERWNGIGRLTLRGTGGGKVGKFTFLLDALEFRKRILAQIDKVSGS